MSGNGIKTRKHKVNPSLTCEKQANKQTCEKEAQTMNIWKKGFKIETLHVK